MCLEIFLRSAELVWDGEAGKLQLAQVFLGHFVAVEVPYVFFHFLRDGSLRENGDETVGQMVFLLHHFGAGLERAFFHKRERLAGLDEVEVGIYKREIHKVMVQVIAQKLVEGANLFLLAAKLAFVKPHDANNLLISYILHDFYGSYKVCGGKWADILRELSDMR